VARKAFCSFHYVPDSHRASQVRNMGVIEGNRLVSSNRWEEIKEEGKDAIKNWIDGDLFGKSVVIVFIGANTLGRKWVKYEIEKGWNDGISALGYSPFYMDLGFLES